MKPVLKIDWATHEAAKYACENWHYSRCVPNQKTVKVGIWENGKFIGCVIFGDGANGGMFTPYGITAFEGCELVRVAISKHCSPVSRIIRISLKFLQISCPKIRLVASFADPEQGHHGGVYQAGGWIYAGMTDAADEYMVKGKRMHGRALRSTRSNHKLGKIKASNVFEWVKKAIDPNAIKIKGSSKHRYLMPLDNEMRKQILPLSKPYPKRAGSDTSDTPAFQAGEGGSLPTPALHSKGGEG